MLDPNNASLRAHHTINLVEEVFRSVELMPTHEREEVMAMILGIMLVDKFGPEARPTLHALHKFCLSKCLLDNPAWRPKDGESLSTVTRRIRKLVS